MLRLRNLFVLLVWLAGASLPLPAAAVDGVLEIHPGCVASGCFPGDSGGFPVQITQSGSYRLTGELVVADENESAILVSAPDVVVDLNGFSLRGVTDCTASAAPPASVTCSPTGSGNGIRGLAANLEVFGGSVVGMGAEGVRASSGARIHDLVIRDSGADGLQIASGPAVVRSATLLQNGGDGIAVAGIHAAVVVQCVVMQNGGDGLSCTRGVVTDSQFKLNVGDGIDCNSGTVRGNSATENGGFALRSISAAGYAENTFFSNNGAGAQPQVFGGIELGLNACNGDTLCP